MNRLPLLQIDEPSHQTLTRIFTAARAAQGMVPDLYRTLGHAPEMLEAWTAMAWPLRSQPKTPRALRELIIMRVAQLTGAAYEWAHHMPMALGAGVSREKLLALSSGPYAKEFTEQESATLEYAENVLADGRVDDAVFDRLRRHFAPGEIVEITLTASFYANVARVLLALRIDVEPEFVPNLEHWP